MANKKDFLKKFILLISVLAVLPLVIKSNYIIQTLIVILLYAYYASSWNIIGGFGGQMSIGHAAYVGLGAYITTVLFTYHKLSPWLGMIVADNSKFDSYSFYSFYRVEDLNAIITDDSIPKKIKDKYALYTKII